MGTGRGDRVVWGIILTTVAGVVCALFVFGLGFYAGKGHLESRLAAGDALIRHPIPPAEAAAPPLPEVTFYERLGRTEQPKASSRPPVAAPTQAKPKQAEPVSPSAAEARKTKRRWTVQVSATRAERVAERLRAQLRERGYSAYVTRAKVNDETWYRVRVGRVPTAPAAYRLAARLRREPGIDRVFVATE